MKKLPSHLESSTENTNWLVPARMKPLRLSLNAGATCLKRPCFWHENPHSVSGIHWEGIYKGNEKRPHMKIIHGLKCCSQARS